MVHEVRLRTGVEAILQRPITDAEFTAFDAIYGTTTGTVDERLNASFSTIADGSSANSVRTVISFYQVFYGRQPDAAGLDFWTDAVESGGVSLNDLATQFATASEFNARFGDRTPVEIVFAQYRNVLGREPDAAGLTFWADQVQSGNLTLADLGRFFATSDEAEARFDPFIDAFLVNAANGNQDFDQSQTLFEETLVGGATTGGSAPIILGNQTSSTVTGTSGADVFQGETGDVTSSSNIDGGAGADILEVFNDGQGTAVSPRMTGVETVVWTEQTNDRLSNSDNNIGGFSNSGLGVDVELDAGRISGVTRWENYDSRADLVIEDVRDSDDVDGTFTADLTVAMVSTDPGNVDYAIYFDDPVNRQQTLSSISLQVIDQNNSGDFTAAAALAGTQNSLEDAQLTNFAIVYNGTRIDIALDTATVGTDFFGANATYATLVTAINAALDATTLADGSVLGADLTASLGGTFAENIGNDNAGAAANAQVFGREILLTSASNATLADAGAGDITVISRNDPADTAQAIRPATQQVIELTTLNVELDDVGKGSMGGDLLAGAMSTGRQPGDDRTSDSAGIQQFNIEVDRSSQLQTINSTNNTLEVVNIVNGENDGPNNTTTASDEQTGDLTVRGVANPGSGGTNNAMPGAVPQHDIYGFTDVRAINGGTMVGDLDLTVGLTDQIIDKYLDTNGDTASNGNADDVSFNYTLGTGDDEFLVNMSDSALADAGTASREDFNFSVSGGTGDDYIVTNVGNAGKFIDGQGQDYYNLTSTNANNWYENQAANNAAQIVVSGGTGADSIWTHGWGDATINAGAGADAVYTDNSGTNNVNSNPALTAVLGNITRNIGEHQQIDYEVGAFWTFNDDNAASAGVGDIQGSTNDRIAIAGLDSNDQVRVTVSFFGAGGAANANTAYTATVNVPAGTVAGSISEQQLNQAIKQAINADPQGVMNKVLEATDGPGQSLAVYSKIDGDYSIADLSISVSRVDNAGPVTAVSLAGTAYDTSGANVGFQNFGAASTAESDNRIIVEADGAADVTVLSTNDSEAIVGVTRSANLNGASNETIVVREGTFGVETVFNFDAGDGVAGTVGAVDRFDFEAIDYTAGTFTGGGGNVAYNTADDSITIIQGGAGGANNTTVANIASTYGGVGTNSEHIVIVYNPANDNSGTVYHVTDTGAANASVDLQGTIELVGTNWADLASDNFL